VTEGILGYKRSGKMMKMGELDRSPLGDEFLMVLGLITLQHMSPKV
jgi:hypothetical protein